jgi:hypothetical protein
MEQRWGERIQVDFPVRLMAHPFAKRDGRLTDLSVSGAYIETSVLIRLKSRLVVTLLASPWARQDAAVLHAYVARKYRQGVGIEWCEFAPAPVGSLLRTVAHRRYAFHRRPPPRASITIARLSGSLLKHPKP